MLDELLDQTATHQRAANAKDVIGGNVQTFATQNAAVPVAVWPMGSSLAFQFLRRDFFGTHVVVTSSDLGARPKDRLLIGGVYYEVNGVEPYSNAAIGPELIYTMDVTRRTI